MRPTPAIGLRRVAHRPTTIATLTALLTALLLSLLGAPATAQATDGPTTQRVSVATDGTQAHGDSLDASISADGRYVAFTSTASDLVAGDTNGRQDVFVHDQTTGVTERVSVATDGTQANHASFAPSISADGRYVAFESFATNLVAGDTNWFVTDVFVHDRTERVTERVSVATGGTQANHASFAPSISADGRYVAFHSSASNLVAGDTNGRQDVFVHDRTDGVTERVSLATDGTQANDHSRRPSISADGRYVAFDSLATNLVAGDTNNIRDVFVHDRTDGVTERVSVATDGTQANGFSRFPSISADGRYVAFDSFASNLFAGETNNTIDVFVHDRTDGVTERVSLATDGTQATSHSTRPSISADGRHVAFDSSASNLVDSDTNGRQDVFVHDRTDGVTERVSVATDGTQANDHSRRPSISADGRQVAFHSFASNLVDDDTNNTSDVFVHDRGSEVGPLAFEGFAAPVDNDGAVNVVTARATVPMRWRLTLDDQPVADPAAITGLTSTQVACPAATIEHSLVEEATTSKSGLIYQDDGYWQFNWATDQAWAKTCREFRLTLDDDSVHTALFRFR